MPTRTSASPKGRPLIDSPFALRVLATAVTLSTFTGISAFAAGHVVNAAAPLQPSNGSSATATPAPTAQTTTRRTTLGSGVTGTSTAPLTRTRRS